MLFLLVRLLLVVLTICVVVIENASSSTIGMVHDDDIVRNDFPADFVFGAGTAANQVEGASLVDGRTLSIWDTYVKSSGVYGANFEIGCDGYHRYKEDIQLMADMGLEAYRLSISWARLIPNGRGSISLKGLQYYNNVINELVAHGIEPHVTLVHFDLPQVLEDEYDGWLSKKSIEDYVAYADVCFREFGDRVLHWVTFNEPNENSLSGYNKGSSPPGRCSYPFGNCTKGNSSTEPYIVAHNMLLAHASAVSLYRTKYKATQQGVIGIDLYGAWYEPYADVPEDVLAAQRSITFNVGWCADPLVFGDYPDMMKQRAGSRLPTFTEVEKKTVKGSFDFLGVNHYNAESVKHISNVTETSPRDFYSDLGAKVTSNEISGNHSGIDTSSLTKILGYFKNEYGNPPIYIHENGKALPRITALNDTVRVEFITSYMGSMLDAIRNGSNTKGYFVWSFIDALELPGASNFSLGLHYVDFKNGDLNRVPKRSAHWYSHFLHGKKFHGEA